MYKTALTYDDIQLIPRHSNISTRKDISLKTKLSKNWDIDIPIVASPMDTVCEVDMAIKMMDLGGVGCIHRFCGVVQQMEMVGKVFLHAQEIDSTLPIMAAIGVRCCPRRP
jgi:IMP dehydrogenase